ncbi:MAG: hypothetical protein K940chlam1_00937 [Candidatus Anoxychlamydiales bacterium]|nr:hypothetical protein [Candidatus Anoxychlamydiales bacterium]NGX35443.1 hypothetical protein [Candidatus Anoxychlamydiales bacterium]
MSYTVNQKINNFTVTKYLPIEEIQVKLIELKHNTLGTEVIKILNDDDENLFCISFKTWPSDSCGAPHILEHTVLCGSEKFPVKDPFFSMLKRSLNTFMNAMTGSDFTCYPASSMVEKDFYNLFEIYIDAVFHPKLNKLSFEQEGHRFAFSKDDDASSDLIYKGVVYNEMKGAMANPDHILIQKMLENLIPDLPYAFNSGGEPNEIPNLTYEGLKDFHKKYYHPSRSIFFLYGNFDLEKELDFIEKNALANVTKKEPLPNLSKQKRFKDKKIVQDSYPIPEGGSLGNKSMIAFGYLTCSIEDQIDLVALELIDTILMGTDASYLNQALIQSKLCLQVESLFETDMSEAPFMIICKGCKSQDKDALLKVINDTLKKLIEDKIPEEIIEAALHQLEFARTEIASGSYPYGLTLFFRSALAKQHGEKPENALVIHSLFKTLKKYLQDPNYLPNLIKKYLLDNSHMVELTLDADPNFLAQEAQFETKKLNKIQKNLTPIEIENILKESLDLKEYQKKLEGTSIECLPKIAIEDIPKETKNYPLKIEEIKKYKIFHHDVFTNEIMYVDLIFDLPYLLQEELIELSLFSSILTEVGANNRNYAENLRYIQAHTGGIDSYLALHIDANNFENFVPSIAIRSKALYKKSDKVFSLLKDILTNPIFSDVKRIKEILLQQYTFLENSIVQSSMKYSAMLSQSSFSQAAFLSAKWDGIDYLNRLRDIVKDIDTNVIKVIDQLNALKSKVLNINNAHLVISSCEKHYSDLKKNNFYNLLDIEFNDAKPFAANFRKETIKSSAHLISSPVAFTASSYKTIGFSHTDSPHLLIAGRLFENKILHKKIREQGGAYGSGAKYSPTSGIFTFNGFRDPHINSTIEAFKLAIQDISLGNFTNNDIDEAKLGVIQRTDVPISPGTRAIAAYSWYRANKTDEMRQKFRDAILSATKEDIIKATKEHLLDHIDEEITISFCSKELLEKEKPNLKITT